MSQSAKINQLKAYFKNRDDVLMAFLFGSQSKGRETKRSDWDIGVYLKPKSGRLEWEEPELYSQQSEIERELSSLLKIDDIDLLIFNNATANIADTAIHGLPLIIKDRGFFLDFMLAVSREAEDYRQTVQEYADIYWRSKSLMPGDRVRLNKILIFLDSEIRDIKEFRQLTQFEYQDENKMKKRSVERWIETIMMSVLDIGKIILASEKRNIPGSYKEIVRNVCLFFDFSENAAYKFAEWAGLRNIVAHEYLDLRWNRQIKPFIDTAEPYLKSFIQAVKKYLEK